MSDVTHASAQTTAGMLNFAKKPPVVQQILQAIRGEVAKRSSRRMVWRNDGIPNPLRMSAGPLAEGIDIRGRSAKRLSSALIRLTTCWKTPGGGG
jgi:hypothetical protein